MVHVEAYESAALTLVPEGWVGGGRLKGQDDEDLYAMELLNMNDGGHSYKTGRAQTPALALCSAALKARES